MCEHHHHNHEHSHGNQNFQFIKISIALLLFITAIFINFSGLQKFLIYFTAYIIAGGDVLLKAIKNILKGEIFDENFLMGIATLGAFAIKEYPEAVMVMILYQIGEFLQHRAVEKSRKSISQLMDIRPDYAFVESNGELIKRNPSDVKIGDIIIVKSGEKIPLDGVVIEGNAAVDTSALTGEPVPRKIKSGEQVISGCINTNGLLKIKVEKEFGQSTVSKILELVEHSSSKKAKAENFITKFARYYTPAVVAGAIILAVFPPLFLHGQFSLWLERALTFLVISCPCALVISIPLGFFAGIGAASREGILIKGACYIEALSNTDTVVFDKTGTLTKGIFKVTQIYPENVTAEELLKYTAYTEQFSNHPIALSLKAAYSKEIDLSLINNIEEIAGKGVKAYVNGDEILTGNSTLMKMFNIAYKPNNSNGTIVYTAKNGKYTGSIVISDELKDDAKFAVQKLKTITKQIIMLTGDNQKSAESIAEQLGIDEFYSELLPAGKVDKLEELIEHKTKNKSVIFIGDGINDAPVLTRADVGIAMGGLGSDAAVEAGDAVILNDKPSKIVKAILIAKKTMSVVKQNIIFALGIKALFLILGAFGVITMWGAVFADVGVTLIAIANSLRLLKN